MEVDFSRLSGRRSVGQPLIGPGGAIAASNFELNGLTEPILGICFVSLCQGPEAREVFPLLVVGQLFTLERNYVDENRRRCNPIGTVCIPMLQRGEDFQDWRLLLALSKMRESM